MTTSFAPGSANPEPTSEERAQRREFIDSLAKTIAAQPTLAQRRTMIAGHEKRNGVVFGEDLRSAVRRAWAQRQQGAA